MKKISIRSATKEDLPILYDFEQGIVEWERPFDETLKEGHINYYDLRSMIEAEHTEVIVAEIDHEIVGSAYVDIKSAEAYLKHSYYGYLGFMFVKPKFRGMGISNTIISHLKGWLLTKNITELRLDVYDENLSAIHAYEKAGFKKHLVNMRIGLE